MSLAPTSKSMSIGESGLTVVFVVAAFLCMIGAAKALDSAFAFHASLGAVASLAAAFAILNRYFDRPASLPAAEINGRPNYNMGPIKFASVMAMFWGIAGFTVGLLIASQLAWPVLNFDLPRRPWLRAAGARTPGTTEGAYALVRDRGSEEVRGSAVRRRGRDWAVIRR